MLITALRLILNKKELMKHEIMKQLILIRVPLKFVSNFWRALEMLQLNFEINFILTRPANCFVLADPVQNRVQYLQ